MKYMQSFIITALFLYLASCAKEDNSLGKQLEGSWLVRSYLYNDEELLLPDDVYTIDFSYYQNGEGETNWFWRTFIIGTGDSSGGVYSIIAEQSARTMHVEWTNPAFWGGYEEANFSILRFTGDTLMLDEEKPGVSHHHITAVRN